MSAPLLEVRDLAVHFDTAEGLVRAVDGVSWSLAPGETLAVVGESGSGKSVTALAILRLLATPPARVAGGEVRFRGRDLLRADERALQGVRGREIAMVFQEPMTSLHPAFAVGDQVAEVLEVHERLPRAAARERAVALLRRVGIPDPEVRAREYPHQLSGGMRQRVMIAIALACRPAVLLADEPTTALDVTIQAQILELLADLRRETGMAVVLVTHNLGIVAGAADRVVVMYAGQVVESAPVRALFAAPRHPYTAGLLASVPRPGAGLARLRAIPGGVPDPLRFPGGCRFHPRCPLADARCRAEAPPLSAAGEGREVRCWRADEIAAGTADPLAPEARP